MSYLKFVLFENKPKTKVYDVVYNDEANDVGGLILGKIKWFPRWRKYTFQPDNYTVWDEGCLKEIIEFLEKLKQERCNKVK